MFAKTKTFYNAVVDVDLFFTIYDYLRFNPSCAKDYNIFSTVDFDKLTFEDWKDLAEDTLWWLEYKQLPKVYSMLGEQCAPSADTWGTLYYQTLNYMMLKDSNIRKVMRLMSLDELKDTCNKCIDYLRSKANEIRELNDKDLEEL